MQAEPLREQVTAPPAAGPAAKPPARAQVGPAAAGPEVPSLMEPARPAPARREPRRPVPACRRTSAGADARCSHRAVPALPFPRSPIPPGNPAPGPASRFRGPNPGRTQPDRSAGPAGQKPIPQPRPKWQCPTPRLSGQSDGTRRGDRAGADRRPTEARQGEARSWLPEWALEKARNDGRTADKHGRRRRRKVICID